MSRSARITAELGGEEYDFCMLNGELMQLQEKLDVGPPVVLARLSFGQWRMEDIPAVIRLGLIGAGMEPANASRLTRIHVDQRTWEWGGPDGLGILAVKILAAAINGAPDEPLGKANGEAGTGSTISPTARSDGATSSAPAS